MMRRSGRQSGGFTLVLTIVLVGAVGLTIGLLSRHFVGLTLTVNRVVLDVRAGQLLAGGRDWMAAHPERCIALADGEIIELPVGDLGPPGSTASLRIVAVEVTGSDVAKEVEAGKTLWRCVITATVRQGKLASTARATHSVRQVAAGGVD